jgi:hypothetical protein
VHDFTSLEYLNVTAGAGEIVEVYNTVLASASRATASATGCPQIGMVNTASDSSGVSGTERIEIKAGPLKLFEKTWVIPPLPDLHMDGNDDRYLAHGIG